MKQKLQTVLICVLICVAFVGLSLWMSWPKGEPSWGGKAVSEWLVELAPSERNGLSGELSQPEWIARVREARRRQEQGQAAIRALGERAVPYVLALLEEPKSRPEWVAVVAGKAGWKLPEPPSMEIRASRAALAFAALGTNAQSALPKLGQLLNHTNTMWVVALCLANIGEAGVPLLHRGLTSTNETLRETCFSQIGIIGTNANVAVPTVLAAVGDANPRVARAAAHIYPGMEPDKSKVIATLLGWSRSNSVNVLWVTSGIRTVGYFRRPHGPEVRPLITELLRLAAESDPKVKAGAISTFGAFGELAAGAKPLLLAALEGDVSEVRLAACGALGAIRLEPESTVPLLIKLAQDDPEEYVRSAALAAAAVFGASGLPFCGPLRAEVEQAIREQAEYDRLWNRKVPK